MIARSLRSIVVALVVASAGDVSEAQEPKTPPRAGAAAVPGLRAIPVTVGRAEARAVQRVVETSGSLLAADEVQAKSEQPGTIARLFVDLGDRVASGAVLVEYDRREFDLAVEQAEADLGGARESLARAQATAVASEATLRRVRDTLATLQAEIARAESQVEWTASEMDRTRRLFEQDLIAARDVDNARNQHNIALAQLAVARTIGAQHPDQVRVAEAQLLSDQAAVKNASAQVRQREATVGIMRKRLGDTTIRAPLAGLIARRHVSAGEYVKENTAIFTIVVANPLKYVGTVPERQAPDVRAGQTVRLTVEAFGDKAFTGTVVRVAPAVDVATRTLVLEARVPNGDAALRPGFFAKGTVLTRQDPTAVFVPGEAITSVAGITKLFVIANGRAEERLVRPASRQGTWVEVGAAVKPGDVVAVSNLPLLFHGAPVDLQAGK